MGLMVRMLYLELVTVTVSLVAFPLLPLEPATRGGAFQVARSARGKQKQWRKIIKLGRLSTDITQHTLRHSFASVAADLEYSDITVGALIGHKGRTTTSRYAHGADAVLVAAADAVANRVVDLMGKTSNADVVTEADKMLPHATA